MQTEDLSRDSFFTIPSDSIPSSPEAWFLRKDAAVTLKVGSWENGCWGHQTDQPIDGSLSVRMEKGEKSREWFWRGRQISSLCRWQLQNWRWRRRQVDEQGKEVTSKQIEQCGKILWQEGTWWIWRLKQCQCSEGGQGKQLGCNVTEVLWGKIKCFCLYSQEQYNGRWATT